MMLVASAWALTSCMELKPHLAADAAPQAATGYVAGFFSWPPALETFAVVAVDALGHEHTLSFRDLHANGSVAGSGIQMIAVPPGDYRIEHWTYSAIHPPRLEVPRSSRLGTPFSLKPGHVLFVGAISSKETMEGRLTPLKEITVIPMRADEAWRLFTRAYPGFRAAPVECLTCEPPSPGAEASAGPPFPDGGDFSPAREIVIHLHSPAHRYADYDLAAWEEVGGGQERRWVLRASERRPLEPRGVDAFGAWWTLSDLEFRDGHAHVSTRGDPPGKGEERSWDLSRGHEVWMNEGDPEVYFTRAEAEAAQGR